MYCVSKKHKTFAIWKWVGGGKKGTPCLEQLFPMTISDLLLDVPDKGEQQ